MSESLVQVGSQGFMWVMRFRLKDSLCRTLLLMLHFCFDKLPLSVTKPLFVSLNVLLLIFGECFKV